MKDDHSHTSLLPRFRLSQGISHTRAVKVIEEPGGSWRKTRQQAEGRRDSYHGPLFRVDELVPVIHSLWFTEREMEKVKFIDKIIYLPLLDKIEGNSGGRRGLLLDSYQTRKEKHPCFNTKTVKKHPQNPTISRLCLHSASVVTLYQSRCKST